MKPILLFFTCLMVVASAAAETAKPQRIVSISLCTDQLLLLLAEREQIASLSNWAVDSNMSYMIDAVGDIPLNNTSIEEIIRFQPDLILASQFAAWDTSRFLRQLGYPVKQIPLVESVAGIYELLTLFGEWTGNPKRARDMIETMQAEIAATQLRYAERPSKSVIIYTPNGYTIGANTLENDLFVQAGYRNLAAEMGIDGFQSISLERLIAANPDVLQIDRRLSTTDSLATAYLAHPALEKLGRQREDLDIATRLRICAGPMITEAIEQMAARR